MEATATTKNPPLIISFNEMGIGEAEMRFLITAITDGASLALISSDEVKDKSIADVPHWISLGNDLPLAAAISADLLESLNDQVAASEISKAGAAIAQAITEGLLIETCATQKATSISASIRSQLLQGAIAQVNIEDYFPNHSWSSFKEESLAACYHTLAALFMRLEDTEAAQACLDQSEEFEDSPRALALKALISKRQGQTLGAVANIVSSLQQYEQRKTETSAHYLAFKPSDLEVINFRLKEGLEALNKRDNEAALSKFTEAVFNFDSFYKEMGLDK